MGSFCSSCFVTRQTIEDGDPVRIFFIRDASGLMTKDIPIVDRKGGRSVVKKGVPLVGPCSEWVPLSGTLRGSYDDYGVFNLNPADNASARTFSEEISPLLCGVESEFADEAFSLVKFEAAVMAKDPTEAWDMLNRAAERGTLFSFSMHQDGPRQVSMAAMHEHAYQYLLENGHNHRGPITPRSLAEPIAAAVATEFANYPADKDRRMLPFQMKIMESFRDIWPSGVYQEIDVARRTAEAEIVRLAESETVVDTEDLIAKLMPAFEDAVVVWTMDQMLLPFEPSRYRGDDYGNNLGADYAKMVAEVQKAV